jgi:hypothetical protein
MLLVARSLERTSQQPSIHKDAASAVLIMDAVAGLASSLGGLVSGVAGGLDGASGLGGGATAAGLQ